MKSYFAALAAVVLLAAVVGKVSAATQYTVTDLGTLANGTFSYALDINASGQIVGSTNSNHGDAHAFLYSSGAMTDLGTLPGGSYSTALGINASGQIVGSSQTNDHVRHAFLYSNGTGMTDLGALPGGFDSSASDINDGGQIVGGSNIGSSYSSPYRAFLYSPGTGMADLGTLPGENGSNAFSINASGLVVGFTYSTNSYFYHAFTYSDGIGMTDMGLLPYMISWPTAINDNGQWVTAGSNTHAFLYSEGTMTDLGTLGGLYASAFGINNKGQVVGASTISNDGYNYRAFVYRNGTMTNLNSLIDPASLWTLERANAINDYGQIVGSGINANGESHAFLLTPIYIQGDINGDGTVNSNDLGALLTHYNQTVPATANNWLMGDFDKDGTVNSNDLGLLLTNYNQTSAATTAVPEPSALLLAAFALFGLAAYAWRKRSDKDLANSNFPVGM